MSDNAADGPHPLTDAHTLLSAVRARRARTCEDLLAALPAVKPRDRGPAPVTWVGDLQQGDGGKGAMVDRLAPHHDLVVRVQGGDNAGHTVAFRDGRGPATVLKNHLVPSGMRHPGVVGVIGNGVLVNPETLAGELADLDARGFAVSGRLLLSDRAHLVLPLHLRADARQEDGDRADGEVIGTTRRGIGPANVCKYNRTGVRVRDTADLDLVRDRLRLSAGLFGLPPSCVDDDVEWVRAHRDLLLSMAADTTALLGAAVEAGRPVLFEGAQGPLIDVDHGIYPYVTTSPTVFHSVPAGTGVDGARVRHRVGVLKAYQTMVGNGGFVTEETGELGALLRERGAESGTTTGRPRRCGWLDLAHAHWSAELNRYTSVVLTKLDVLDGFDRIGVCVGYRRAGDDGPLPFRPEEDYLRSCTPIYTHLPGWRTSTTHARDYADLPAELTAFAGFVSAYLGVPVSGISKGPHADDLIVVPGGELAEVMAPAPEAPVPTAGAAADPGRDTAVAPGRAAAPGQDQAAAPGPDRAAPVTAARRAGDPGTGRAGSGPCVAVFCGAGAGTDPRHRRLAAQIGAECARRGTHIVYGAGGVGMMGALSDAALEGGGTVTGIIPRSLMEREFGRRDLHDLRVVASMHERKALMYDLADAVLVLPGGYGTFDELFEAVTWTQLGLHDKPVVLAGASGYFDPLVGLLDHALTAGFITPDDRALVRHAATAGEALDLLSPGRFRPAAGTAPDRAAG
ncbi:TIGR00730 family Rossman fold protein [Nocardiopsis sediminis]|uniref:Adenylosuccinate synthetase n=1 Tax=Nocardiopsis sediminis TaxID=1778267 RepID=A0ABV8FR97_9ACTN